MIEAPHFSAAGAKKKTVALPATLFDGTVNQNALHRAVVTYLANQRQGTHNTKTRSEVSGGNQKPFRQKGTGRARQGSIRAPQWRHGGVVHGPEPRSYAKAMPRKMRRAALAEALSAKVADGAVWVLEALSVEAVSTKSFRQVLDRLGVEGKTMLVLEQPDLKLALSARNLPNLTVRVLGNAAPEAPAEGEETEASGNGKGRVCRGLSTREVVGSDRLLFTRAALDRLQEAYAE